MEDKSCLSKAVCLAHLCKSFMHAPKPMSSCRGRPNWLPAVLQACCQASLCNARLASRPVSQSLKAGGSCFGLDLGCDYVIIIMHCLQPVWYAKERQAWCRQQFAAAAWAYPLFQQMSRMVKTFKIVDHFAKKGHVTILARVLQRKEKKKKSLRFSASIYWGTKSYTGLPSGCCKHPQAPSVCFNACDLVCLQAIQEQTELGSA